MSVRQATKSDLIGIYMCGKANLPLYYSIIELPLLYVYCEMYVYDVEGAVQGFIIIHHKEKGGHIASLAVNKEYRRKGVGSLLVNATRLSPLTLNVHVENESAIEFYRKNGFKENLLCVDYYNGALDGSNDAYEMLRG